MEESGCIEIIIRSGESGFKHLGFGAFMITEGKEQANKGQIWWCITMLRGCI